MKAIRQIGSLAFVLGLFVVIFAGVPWYILVADDPVAPWWMKTAVFCLLGGILVVLVSLALERKMVFRIGVNLGDVIQSEDAIYGDGVNIAARMEGLTKQPV